MLTCKGTTKSIREWSQELNIKRKTLYRRLEIGWSIEKTLSEPLRVQ